jgi:3-hydroxybutyryl-CoA dehydrogenase
MAKPRIAVIGAGLMGHGIAQVFALAGHDVTLYDAAQASLDSAKDRILTNLKDLGEDQSAVETRHAGRRSRPSGARRRLRG